MSHKAMKVVIITEAVLLPQVEAVIDACGGTGYTVVNAGGKGSRGVRSSDRPGIGDSFRNVKIEVITNSEEVAHAISEQVAERFFANYAGITYLEEVGILRPHKF